MASDKSLLQSDISAQPSVYVRVALDVPAHKLFDYLASGVGPKDVGYRVLVPFGRRIAVGVIMAVNRNPSSDVTRVRAILRVLRDIPPLPSDVLQLLEFCSGYYHHPIGEAVLRALPVRMRSRIAVRSSAAPCHRLTELGRGLDIEAIPVRLKAQRALLARFRSPDFNPRNGGARLLGARQASALKNMVAKGWLELVADPPIASSPSASRSKPTVTLTNEQRFAVEQVSAALGGFATWLLHGITGSGKTEVYLELMAAAMGGGHQVLLLVPEINLTPQLHARVTERFPGTAIATLHSGMSEGQRSENWLLAHAGTASIVLGTRMAVFAPLPRLGLVIVDEEHDTSFKQAEGLRYSARDMALLRAKMRGVPAVLGSATPSMESYAHAMRQRYRLLTLTRRANADLPVIECVPVRGEMLVEGLSAPLISALRETHARHEQSLVYINRRGYAPVLYCRSCGWLSQCERCDSKLVVHLNDARMRCHHCGYQLKIPRTCPGCGNQDLAPLGQGTQRIEAALARLVPGARILRVDRDSTRRRQAWSNMRRSIDGREVDILVGTQMLAKGHDFPALTMVGVLNADAALYSTDFRAGERLFAGLTQVAGRAGRARRSGRVLIQTEFPQHPLYQALCRHDFVNHATQILDERRQASLPPYSYLAVLRAEAPQMAIAVGFLQRAANFGRPHANNVAIFDAVPAALPRLAGWERAQLTVQSSSRTALRNFLDAWQTFLQGKHDSRLRWSLDVDPIEI